MSWRSLALAGDGSYYLVRILGRGEIFGPDTRVLANALREAPVLMLRFSGVTDTHVLSLVLGVGQLILPALVWSTAVLLARSARAEFVAVTLTGGICAGTTWFFNVSESLLAVPLTVLVAVLLWQQAPWRWGHAALATAASVVLVASYETAVATGVVLGVWAGWRAADARTGLDRYGGAAVAALSALSVAVAIAGAVRGTGPPGAKSSLYFILSGDPWPLYVGLIAAALIVGSATERGEARHRRLALVAGVAVAAVAVIGLEPRPVAAFQARGGAALAGLAAVLFLWWHWARRRHASAAAASSEREGTGRPRVDWAVASSIALVAALMAANLLALGDWTRSLDAFREQVNRVQGVAEVDDVLREDEQRAVWDWASPSLSLVVREGPTAGILVDGRPRFVPFPPSAARAELDDDYAWSG
jgi:hypothetical protein